MRERMHQWLSARMASRVAVAVWVLMIAGVIGRVAMSRPEKGSVVPIYLTAGERWVAGEPLYGYVPGLDLYRNPPGVAVLFAPLTVLDPKLAATAWRLACLAVYALGVRRMLNLFLPHLKVWEACTAWVLSAVLVLPAFNNGQINLLIVGTAICGGTALAKGRWWEAAAWLAGCGWLKVYPLAVGMLACVAVPRQLTWRLALTCGLAFGLPFVCQHPGYVLDRHAEFIHETSVDDRSVAEIVRAPRDWTILARTWFGVTIPQSVALGVSLVSAGIFAVSVWLNRRSLNAATILALALGLVWLTLFGPRTEANTYSMLAPVVAMLSVGLPNAGTRTRLAGWVAGGCLLSAIVRAAFGGDGPFSAMGIQAVGALILVTALLSWGLARQREKSGTGGI